MKHSVFSKRKILTCLILLSTVVFTNACQVNSAYSNIFSESLDIVRFDKQSNSLWMADFVGEEVLRVVLDEGVPIRYNDSVMLVSLPNDTVVSSLCVSDDVWAELLTLSSEEFSIYKYDREIGTWQKNSDFASAKCKVFNNGGIAFWSTNKLLLATANTETVIINTPENLWDVSRDNVGNFWLATEDGGIFQYNGSSRWDHRYATIESPYIFFDTDNYLWVVNYEKVLRYDLNNSDGDAEKIIEIDLGAKQSIFQDSRGRIWIIGTTKMFVWNGSAITEIRPPNGVNLIRYGDYDPNNNILFISTDAGVFSILLEGIAE